MSLRRDSSATIDRMDEVDAGNHSNVAGRATRVAIGIEGDVASTVYGTVVAMATLTAAFATEDHPATLAVVVVSSTVVLWLAHIHAHLIGESLTTGRRISRADVRRMARAQAGIVLAAVPATACLLLGATGLLRENTAVVLAFAAGVAVLTIAGIRYSRLEHLSGKPRLLVIAVNVGLGLLIVLLKATVAH
jgi:hypothetical protein